MDLLERYVQAVKFWLPAKMQVDIAAELSEDLTAQAEAQEATLGRKLHQEEWETILKRRGRPQLVANSYLPQRYLIGPQLFPVYCFVLKVMALCYQLPSLVMWFGFDALTVPLTRPPLWNYFWITLIPSFVITGVFAVLERFRPYPKWLERWNPTKLPPARDVRNIPRASSAFELVINLAVVAWAVYALQAAALFDRHGVSVTLAPTGRMIVEAFVILSSLGAAMACANLVRPYWSRTRFLIRIATQALATILFALTFHSGPFVSISGPMHAVEITRIINTAVTGTLLGAVAIGLSMIILHARLYLLHAASSSSERLHFAEG